MTKVAVISYETDATAFSVLKLERPRGFSFSPGQYVQYSADANEKVKYLALASHPDEKELMLAGRLSEPGATVEISAAQGNGFASNFAETKPYLYVTHGTGISAIRPAIIERLKQGHRGDTLLYGAREAAVVPHLDCLSAEAGVSQLRAYSRGSECNYVQQVLETLDISSFGTVLLIGSKEMMTACRDVLGARKFSAEKIFSNF